jgi:hypothetical protein
MNEPEDQSASMPMEQSMTMMEPVNKVLHLCKKTFGSIVVMVQVHFDIECACSVTVSQLRKNIEDFRLILFLRIKGGKAREISGTIVWALAEKAGPTTLPDGHSRKTGSNRN